MEVVDLMELVSNDFAKIGYVSLEGISNAYLTPPARHCFQTAYEVQDDLEMVVDGQVEKEPLRLSKVNDETSVFGIDTSNIVLGDTGEGILCAVRGSIVWNEQGRYQYVRHGPFIFHITERNKFALYNTLRQIYVDAEGSIGAPILERVAERIRAILERWLQRQLCIATNDALLLWDGSLTTRAINTPLSVLGELLRIARQNRNYVLAFSKKTTLTVSGHRLHELIDDRFVPCILDIDDAVRSLYGSHLRFFGRMYVTKLSPSPLAFRLDVDRQIPEDEGFAALGRLLGNELLRDSYPETLRLAHVLSRFSASEVLAMQRYVKENYGLRVDPELDVRQVLFGPYGGSNTNFYGRVNSHDASL
jgi:hypothetical protein